MPATCVVMSAEGYPGVVRGGDKISGLESVNSAVVFQAGTKRHGADLVTAGGRVLGVTASGPDLESSIKAAYAAVDQISFRGNALPERYRRLRDYDVTIILIGPVAQLDRAAAS